MVSLRSETRMISLTCFVTQWFGEVLDIPLLKRLSIIFLHTQAATQCMENLLVTGLLMQLSLVNFQIERKFIRMTFLLWLPRCYLSRKVISTQLVQSMSLLRMWPKTLKQKVPILPTLHRWWWKNLTEHV